MLHVARVALAAGEVAVAHRVDRRSAARLAVMRAQDLGPSFVKIGQFASTRGDVLSAEYFEEFASLRDDVRSDCPSLSEERVRRGLRLGSLDEAFVEFDPEPFASASVAQVHRARLRSTGAPVAVKLIKHGVREAIETDIRAAEAVVDLVARCNPSAEPRARALLDRFAAVLRRETDMQAEAGAATSARGTLLRALGEDVIVPRPVMSGPGVLVMEYVPSRPVGEARDKRRVTSLIIESILSLITAGEAFHQDPHEGNIGVVVEGGRERLVIYDFGNVSRLSARALDGLVESAVAFQLKDATMLANALVKHRLVLSEASESRYRPALMQMINQGFEYVRSMDIRSFDIASVDREAAELMTLSEEVNGVMRAVTMAEGVCKGVYPRFDLQGCIDQYMVVHSVDVMMRRAERDLRSLRGCL